MFCGDTLHLVVTVTHQHQKTTGLDPGAAASEEAHHEPSASDGHEDGVGTQAGVLGQECGIPLVAEAQPQAGAQEGATAELKMAKNQKKVA